MWKSMAVATALACSPVVGAAQSALDRPPDLSGGWVGDPGRIHFHFMHRFEAGPAPARKVTNTPTFLLGVPLGDGLLTGFNYATNSNVARGRPNEWELFGRWAPIRAGSWRLAVQAGYNLGAESADGEVTVGGGAGRVEVFGVGRVFSGWRDSDDVRFAAGAGARLGVTGGLALAGDVVAPVDLADDESPAWSAGVQLEIPYTPHTLSLHASNAATTTLHGSTVGAGAVRYGFEFTIPVTLRRYLPSGSGSADTAAGRARAPAGAMASRPDRGTSGDTVEIRISGLAYGVDRVDVRPGGTVVWVNDDPVAHTATADDASWNSDLIAPGDRWARTFSEVGEYSYHCTPHPFMKAVIVVAAEGEME
jgi:plastocyanin